MQSSPSAGRWRRVGPWAVIGAIFQIAILQIPENTLRTPDEILVTVGVNVLFGALLGALLAVILTFLRDRPSRSALPFKDMTMGASLAITILVLAAIFAKVFLPPSLLPLILAAYPIVKLSTGRKPQIDPHVFD